MSFLFIFILLASALFAANPPTISAILTSDITHSSARITWTTDTASTTKIEFGDSVSYGTTHNGPSSVTSHAYFISGMRGDTLIHYRVCSTDTVEACSADQTFVTLPLPSPHPAIPVPPTSVNAILLTYPTINGTTFTVAANCSDLQTQINSAAAADGALNHVVNIPAGTLCNGQWTLPAKSGINPSGTGLIVVQSNFASLPAEGTQVTAAISTNGQTAILRTNFVGFREEVSTSLPGTCPAGDYLWGVDVANNAFIRRCNPVNTWEAVTVAEWTTPPATCVDGELGYDTDGAGGSAARYYWCIGTNNWVNIKLGNPGFVTTHAAITLAAGAHHWYIGPGIEVTHVPTPAALASFFNVSPSNSWGSWAGCLMYVRNGTNNIVIDRSILRGQGYPSRLFNGICEWDAAHSVLRNSLFLGMNHWTAAAANERSTIAVNILNSTGPGLIENNFFDNCMGICVFTPEDAGVSGAVPSDYTVRRNLFRKTGTAADPLGNGRRYWQRHQLELKRGRRWLLQGNIFDGGWFEVGSGAGALVAFTPRSGSGAVADNDQQIADIDVRDNILANSGEAFRIAGRDVLSTATVMTRNFQRLRIDNNLSYGIDSARTTSGTTTGDPAVLVTYGIEDVTISRNTNYSSVAAVPDFLNIDGNTAPNGEGLTFRNNIHTHNYGGGIGIGIQNGFGEGTAALDLEFGDSAPGVKGYTVTKNAFQRAGGDPTTYPTGNFFPTSIAAVGFADAANGNYRLAAGSTYKSGQASAASDGSDLGVNFGEFSAAQAELLYPRVIGTGQTQAVIAYTAPDTVACSVDTSTAATFAGAARVVDSGGGRHREVRIATLTGGTLYYYRINCRLQATGSFTTKSSGGGAATVTVSVKPPSGLPVTDAVVDYGADTSIPTTTGAVACATGCTVSVPATLGATLFHRVRYRDAGAATIATGAILTASP